MLIHVTHLTFSLGPRGQRRITRFCKKQKKENSTTWKLKQQKQQKRKQKQRRNRNTPRDAEVDGRHGCCSTTVGSPTRGRHLISATPFALPRFQTACKSKEKKQRKSKNGPWSSVESLMWIA
ncbi:hypothetical protein MGYG_05567 [Nannizzia gypsea CBS 118893]|uniref:Uncharacterized protein n=1 Tax=Arthroderma gypseum (strain ATCC MYA-4604 / CBS 118893) TaxID=535722 RepID=E4UWM8_ARTGP|nr:hypothetical protein MGYG_05567 [Nannizzia gypsea CBS 118893]EFR02571.1 hypothetical protein MGYG_05567 [Nannizzia gypsea CBS 118893]